MVLLACIFDVLQLSNMGSVLSVSFTSSILMFLSSKMPDLSLFFLEFLFSQTLVYIFNYYNKMSRLVRFSIAHELITIFRKWESSA